MKSLYMPALLWALFTSAAMADVELPHPELVVSGSNGVVLHGGRVIGQGSRTGSNFGIHKLPMAAPITRLFRIGNRGSENMVIGVPTITGPDAGDFTSELFTHPVTIPPSTSIGILISFHSQTLGGKIADYKFTTNSPGIPEYTLPLDGYCLEELPTDLYDITLTSLKPPKVKVNKKDATVKIMLKYKVTNVGTKTANNPIIKTWRSFDNYLDLTDPVAGEDVQLKKPLLPGKSKTVKVKLVVPPNSTNFVFSEAGIDNLAVEFDRFNNIVNTAILN